MIIQDLQYNYEGHMALALAQYKDLFVRGYLYVYSLRWVCHLEGELYICLPIENLAALTC